MRAASIVFLSILACAPAAHAVPWPDLAEPPRSKTREGARDAALIVAGAVRHGGERVGVGAGLVRAVWRGPQ